MSKRTAWQRRMGWPLLGALLWFQGGPAARAADTLMTNEAPRLRLKLPGNDTATTANSLVWNQAQGRVDADINDWNLRQLLENVAARTGWHVFLDPGAAHKVSARFKDLSTGEALRWLLGDLNYAVVPQTNGASRLYVFRTSQSQATMQIHAPPKSVSAKPIPNELIVTLKPGSKTKIEELARLLGAKIVGRMDGQNAYRLQFENEAAAAYAREQLAQNPDVQSIDENFSVPPPPQVDVAAGIAGAPDLELKPKDNDGNCQLVIGLPDTVVQPLNKNLEQFLMPRINVAGDCPPTQDQLTHGTAMAETILKAIQAKTGGGTSVKILPVNIYPCGGESTTTFDVANGIVQAVNNGANVLNLSLGSTGDSQFLHNTITQVSQLGIPIFAAAGNEPVTTPTYPAAYSEVVAVTASDPNGNIASYANRGNFIDMMAPGTSVVGYDGKSYMVQGTSTATAIASGLAAGLADSAHACADQATALLQQSVKQGPAAKTQ